MKTQSISKMHIDSFDWAMSEGLMHLCERLQPCEIEFTESVGVKVYKYWIELLYLGHPYKSSAAKGFMKELKLFPAECRMSETSYAASLTARVARQIDNSVIERFEVNLGNFPIMVKSEFCHLSKLTEKQALGVGEDVHELGGYFIVNGVERLIRLLIVQKQNYPLAILRPAFTSRGNLFTPLSVIIRCVRNDLHSQSVTAHYLADGTCTIRFILRRGEIFIPAIILLKCFRDANDQEVYHKIVRGNYSASQNYSRVEVMIRESTRYSIYTKKQALEFLGNKCKTFLNLPSYMTDEQIGQLVVTENVFVHLDDDNAKFELLMHMIEKLFALAEGEIAPENADVLSSQEFLLPGHLCLNFIKEKLEDTMESVKARFLKECTKLGSNIRDSEYFKKVFEQHAGIGKKFEYLLATGNLISRTGLDLMQTNGFSIIADRINYSRYTSHFQSVHRGAYFTEMKISSVRKLHPESWGFLCPVHTPDGAPCGLLNHIASRCRPLGKPIDFNDENFLEATKTLETITPITEDITTFPKEYIPIMLNGKIVAYTNSGENCDNDLRTLKVKGVLPRSLEIAYLPRKPFFPGIYLFTGEGRLVREVKHLATGKKEWIGPLEQLNLKIGVIDEERDYNTTHQETSPLSMLSILACCIPFPDHNQSPRNMYQCQMAKQTMGQAMYNYPFRADNKAYRLTTPQKPLVNSRAKPVRNSGFDEYPSGTNAVVAVISYTGYDMEDAMIINKSAYERGLGHGYVYKSKFKEVKSKDAKFELISKDLSAESIARGLDSDGLPYTGTPLTSGQPELMLYNTEKTTNKVFLYKDSEGATIEDIKLVADENDSKISFRYRLLRNPIIGDKFSSRHGQKGVLSILWPQEDMPFTEQGITPDIIINPHAFPSRMTIGMLIESMAGKSGAMLGKFQESSAFQNFDKVQVFGSELAKLGFNYYGSETMYSGIFGNQMTADIYIGVVYYQRLRHMVADKFQARSTGPVDMLTQQPVKGRKKHGGIRLGEMERDSLLGHGGAFMLYDRLFKCSDYSEGYCCKKCGSILACYMKKGMENAMCQVCGVPGEKVTLPFVLRYLANELAAMNIKLKFNLTEI